MGSVSLTKTPPMSAEIVVGALEKKHAKDVFVTECNTGSTWGGCRRLDAWAFKRSWSPFTVVGYEVKVSRSDFQRDTKWQEYLDYCHCFYFVVPWGMLQPAEIPSPAGLMWVSSGGGRVITKKKPTRRTDPGKLWEVMAYILMSRSRIVADMHEANGHPSADKRDERMQRWERWLADKKRGEHIDLQVKGAIAEKIREQDTEARHQKHEFEKLQHIHDRIRELGFDPTEPIYEWAIRNKLDDLVSVVPPNLPSTMNQAIRELRRGIEAAETIGTTAEELLKAADA